MEPTTPAAPEFVALVIPAVDYQTFAACFYAANLGNVSGDTRAIARKYLDLCDRVNQPQAVNIQDEPALPANVTPISGVETVPTSLPPGDPAD